MKILINGKIKEFDSIYYFSPIGNFDAKGTEDDPFFIPTDAILSGALGTGGKNICFFIKEGYYSDFDIWLDMKNQTVVNNLNLSIYGENGQKTIIDCSKLILLNQRGSGTHNINIYNLKIKWSNIVSDFNGIISGERNINIPITHIKFYNDFIKIGNLIDAFEWYFYANNNIMGSLTFENCILDTEDFYIEDSLDLMPAYSNSVILTNNIVNSKLKIEELPQSLVTLNYNYFIKKIEANLYTFPLNSIVSHKGSDMIKNPDDGKSHIGVCGGQEAWFYNTYWYKFLDTDNYFIPLDQIKQAKNTLSAQLKGTLETQINYIESLANQKNNKNRLLVYETLNTYNYIINTNTPNLFYIVVDENYLQNYDENIHTIKVDLQTPYYSDRTQELKVFKNGVLQNELQYTVTGNSVILYNVNFGDEIQIYIGWKAFNNRLHIEYNNKQISKIINNTGLTNDIKYDEGLVTENFISNGNQIIQTKNYVYDKNNNIANLINRINL